MNLRTQNRDCKGLPLPRAFPDTASQNLRLIEPFRYTESPSSNLNKNKGSLLLHGEKALCKEGPLGKVRNPQFSGGLEVLKSPKRSFPNLELVSLKKDRGHLCKQALTQSLGDRGLQSLCLKLPGFHLRSKRRGRSQQVCCRAHGSTPAPGGSF